MSDLEKYIMENREKFSDEEPGAGHSGRFGEKLRSGRRPSRKVRFRHILQVAASVAILIASGVVIVKSNQGSGKTAAVEIPEQYQEAYDYYVNQVNYRYDEISSFNFTEEEQKEMLMNELSEMDTYYQDLLKELDAQPGDERVINALIRHYQMKVSVMDRIIEQLNQINDINKKENENTSI